MGPMSSDEAYACMVGQEKGAFIVRLNEEGGLRLSIRSTLEHDENLPKLVGHIIIRRNEEGHGWFTGSKGKYPQFDFFYDILKDLKEKPNTIYEPELPYIP